MVEIMNPILLGSAKTLMKVGDILLYKGYGSISQGIRLFTEFSHAAFIYRNLSCTTFYSNEDHEIYYEFEQDHNIYVSEATFPRFKFSPLDDRVRNYNGEVYYLRLLDMSNETRFAMRDFLTKENAVKRKYGVIDLFKSIFGRVLPDITSLLCSEAIGYALYSVQYTSTQMYKEGSLWPGDIIPFLEEQGKKFTVRKIIYFIENEAQNV